jgi:hypothetical protein
VRRREWEEEEEEAFLSPLVDFSSENLCLKASHYFAFSRSSTRFAFPSWPCTFIMLSKSEAIWLRESVETRW